MGTDKMDDSTSSRKRKRPSYLTEDYTENASDDEVKIPKKKGGRKDDLKTVCFLCKTPPGSSSYAMGSNLAETKYRYSDILCKLFKKEHLPCKLSDEDLSSRVLCTLCKNSVQNLYRLQYELREAKNGIVNTYKGSQKPDKQKEDSADVNSDIITTKNKFEKKASQKIQEDVTVKEKKVKDEPEDDVYIIESLKEKDGDKFLVKWEHFSDDENTWEPRSSIPDYILQFYEEDPKRLGKPAPIQPTDEQDEITEEEEFTVENIL